jgi:hypothetical protein
MWKLAKPFCLKIGVKLSETGEWLEQHAPRLLVHIVPGEMLFVKPEMIPYK